MPILRISVMARPPVLGTLRRPSLWLVELHLAASPRVAPKAGDDPERVDRREPLILVGAASPGHAPSRFHMGRSQSVDQPMSSSTMTAPPVAGARPARIESRARATAWTIPDRGRETSNMGRGGGSGTEGLGSAFRALETACLPTHPNAGGRPSVPCGGCGWWRW